ncbi:MAG: hypothetical protein BAA04_06090 [Firmicutes bacterium ZCTH02-B6]|nr:MAG: hypothetical protein BAA04_06090 [Firmicutes bacterium ZCTH02-B6]
MFGVLILRTLLVYVALLVVVRLTGKREMGHVSPFDFVVAILIAEVAVLPIAEPQRPVWNGLVPLATIVFAELALSWLTLKSQRVRDVVTGRPSIVIRDGRLVEEELRSVRFCIDDLLESLRSKDVADITDVEVAILEPNGSLSVIRKSQCRPVTPADLGVSTRYEGLPLPVIKDGVINDEALAAAGLDRAWLNEELRRRGIGRAREVFYAQLNTAGELFVQLRKARGRDLPGDGTTPRDP